MIPPEVKQAANIELGDDMSKVQPKDIITEYTVMSGGTIDQGFGGFFTKSITIQDWFETAQEAHEWEAKVKQFILENRNDTRRS